MAYLIGIVAVALLFLALHYFTEFTKSQKATVTAVIFSIIFGAISYNSYSNAQDEKLLNAVRKFEQNKTIHCKGEDVNSTNYTLSIGTYTFIGKANTPHTNQMISASECE